MLKFAVLLTLIVTATSAFSMECFEMYEPYKTLCVQNVKTQRMLSRLLNEPEPEPVPQTQYLCSAQCIAGNNPYYNTNVKDYFYSRTDGVSERLLKNCQDALPIEQRRNSRVLNVDCQVAP